MQILTVFINSIMSGVSLRKPCLSILARQLHRFKDRSGLQLSNSDLTSCYSLHGHAVFQTNRGENARVRWKQAVRRYMECEAWGRGQPHEHPVYDMS